MIPQPTSLTTPPTRTPWPWLAVIAYLLLLAYGTLFPLSGWQPLSGGWSHLVNNGWSKHVSRSDVITNLVVYLPLGLLLTHALRLNGGIRNALAAALIGGSLSMLLEYTQSYLPQRVPSLLDVALNTSGAALGAGLATILGPHAAVGVRLRNARNNLAHAGPVAGLGLAILGLWALAQLTPLVPSLDLGNLRQGLKPLAQTLDGTAPFSIAHMSVYALTIAALGLLFSLIALPRTAALKLFGLFVACVLMLKVPVVMRQLSWEALAGCGAGLLAWLVLRRAPAHTLPWLAALILLAAHSVDNLRVTDPFGPLRLMNWIPFRGQMQSLSGLADIIGAAWPYAALAFFTAVIHPTAPRRVVWLGGVILFGYGLGLEWLQQRLPSRYPDITDAVLGVAAWSLAWLWLTRRADQVSAPTPLPPAPRLSLLTLIGGASLAFLMAATIIIPAPLERPLDQGRLAQLPAPQELTPVLLPGFRYNHPRLPSPSAAEINRLRSGNRNYLRQRARRAARGKGHLETVVLMAVLKPGSQDLTLLHRRLLALNFTWRGQLQVRPLALAYDWLYDAWNETQRRQLRSKLLEGCNYEINFIRKERLSPYNVILYNSPLQALMACAIATYGDDPRAEPIMAFTHDLWKKRVLPVWRQIMGQNGGWHEGGEYVGIGIGQAIYELPAMWRRATGEDLFKSEPGIRGFLDFLVYRTRPDGTHFRWGDAGFFDRIVPDQWALALEYRHPAAYSLRRPPKHPIPTSWPWGPLTDPSLYDSKAFERLPLAQHFDGVGLLVARNGWDKDSTYVSFKAGDNYWSHMHLDQGAFEIYKGGALAIDSGLYGTGYGTDHHLNYTYQTIAHNVVTVTDPEDITPIPARKKKPPRPIANDGGQRRVGSGWGIESAPLDLAEWQAKREIYETGTIEQLLLDRDGLNVAIADLTPAYTNSLSGQGTFSHRTRRVEAFQRIFGYDSIDDVIVIYDQVTSTEAGFRKRWLLHTLEKPQVTKNGFIVRTAPTTQPGHGGGRLEAHVLLPSEPQIHLMGGAGFDFFIDGRNYDEGVAKTLTKRKGTEPGAWRVEVMPEAARESDEFLVVLLPTLGDQAAPHRVQRLKAANGVGVEIVGPQRTTRWWFEATGTGARIETITPTLQQTHILGASQPNSGIQ